MVGCGELIGKMPGVLLIHEIEATAPKYITNPPLLGEQVQSSSLTVGDLKVTQGLG